MAETPHALEVTEATHGQLQAVHVVDEANVLRAIGFDLTRPVGTTRLVAGSRSGEMAASIAGVEELDGVALVPFDEPSQAGGGAHPNGVVSIDHVVIATPNPDRTAKVFEASGLEVRRVRRIDSPDGPRRQTFHWFGDVIAEVVGPDGGSGEGGSRLWGLAFTVADIDATVAQLNGHVTEIKDAVQVGRRVCTLDHPKARTPILFISAHKRER